MGPKSEVSQIRHVIDGMMRTRMSAWGQVRSHKAVWDWPKLAAGDGTGTLHCRSAGAAMGRRRSARAEASCQGGS